MLIKNSFLSILGLLIVGPFHAAPALPSALCSIEGVVKKIEEREHFYRPEEWRKAWALPKSKIYIDITLELKVIEGSSCGFSMGEEKKFQLRDQAQRPQVEVGKCLRAQTQYAGDEFALGQWLWEIKECS